MSSDPDMLDPDLLSDAGKASERLIAAASLVAQTDRPHHAALALIRHVAEKVRAADVSLWLLERGDARYVAQASTIPDRWSEHVLAMESLTLPRGVIGSSGVVRHRASRRNPSDSRETRIPEDGIFVVGRRGTTPVGFILIADRQPAGLSRDDLVELRLCAQLLVQIYQREFAYNHLKASQSTFSFYGSEEDLFQSLILQVAASARMEFAALREYESETNGLRTLETFGFDTSLERGRFDLQPVSDFPPFQRALEGKTEVAPSMNDPEYASLAAIPELERVRSFVAMPIRVGTEIFGVLSVAASCEYEYNTLERRAFEGLANAAGLAIRFYRSNHEMTSQLQQFTEISTALTSVEVAQAARHEAIIKVGNTDQALTGVGTALSKRNVSLASERLSKVKKDNQDVVRALNKIRLAMTPVTAELDEVPLKELWEEARSATAGKLAQMRVRTRITGPSATVLVFPDRMRQVFMNLFLNSADAFETMTSHAQREIVITIEQVANDGAPTIFSYRDNAGGLQLQLLRARDTEPKSGEPADRIVFVKGVTSKETGTGYGLWLANRLMQQHGGSIAVLERRKGMMFGLELPDPQAVELVEGRLQRRR